MLQRHGDGGRCWCARGSQSAPTSPRHIHNPRGGTKPGVRRGEKAKSPGEGAGGHCQHPACRASTERSSPGDVPRGGGFAPGTSSGAGGALRENCPWLPCSQRFGGFVALVLLKCPPNPCLGFPTAWVNDKPQGTPCHSVAPRAPGRRDTMGWGWGTGAHRGCSQPGSPLGDPLWRFSVGTWLLGLVLPQVGTKWHQAGSCHTATWPYIQLVRLSSLPAFDQRDSQPSLLPCTSSSSPPDHQGFQQRLFLAWISLH